MAREVRGQAIRLANPRDRQAAIHALPGGEHLVGAWARRCAALTAYRATITAAGEFDADSVLGALLHLHSVRAELYDHAAARPAATSPVLTAVPDLPTAWWAAVRVALEDIASVRTSRMTIHQSFLDHTMPRLLGTPIDTTAPRPWTTAHGDFHFANISAPALCLFDFEGWGLAPTGYDAATLHSYSLLVPPIAARIRTELVEILDTPSGRFAELVAITELLHAATRRDHLALAEPLRRRASLLLGRPVPNSS